ncbi:MAG: DUF3276 family protein [Bacteroidia bacterium]
MNDYSKKERDEIFSKKIRAGKRTYFFDVKSTKGSDFFITITESKKKFDENNYVKHKIFLYKEDFNKFMEALEETINHVKTDLMPDYNFEEFDRVDNENNFE